MKRIGFLALAAAAVLHAPVAAQVGEGGKSPNWKAHGAPENTVAFIISKKSDWKGTDELVAKLDVIAKKLDEDTKDVVAKIKAALPPEGTDPEKLSEEERQALIAKLQAVQPQREEFKAKDEAAVGEALKVMSEEQQAAVKKLLESRSAAHAPVRDLPGQ